MFEELLEKNFLLRALDGVLTPSQKGSLIKFINSIRKKDLEERMTPGAIVLFVTNRCQMGCDFCLYKEKLNKQDPLISIDELKRIARSLKDLPRLILTGGEPFLRDDIDQICQVFNRYADTSSVSISTNGFLFERIPEKVEKILKTTKLGVLKVQVSLDAFGYMHDRVREVEGAFDNAVKTIRALKKLQEKHRNLYIEIASMVNPHLINDIRAFVDHFQELKVPIKFSIIRGDDFGLYDLDDENMSHIPLPRSKLGVVAADELEAFYNVVKRINDESAYKFWSSFQQMKFKNSITILNNRKRLFPCYAGKFDAVIYHNADVAFCENTLPIGNLREYNFDFPSLWQSFVAKAFREKINHCVCIHGCNMITSMSYDDETLVALVNSSQ